MIPGLTALARLPKQLIGANPFGGDYLPTRVPVFFQSGRRTTPYPHPWNFDRPIDILDAYFHRADEFDGAGRHNRYFDFPGFAPVFVSRDPAVIRSILKSTGDKEGQFDRDTMPSAGIARATGEDTLLFGNGSLWRRQRKVSASPFGKTALFQLDIFSEFENTFRNTVSQRLMVLRKALLESGNSEIELEVEPEVKALMLEMLAKCFFGCDIAYDEIRERYVPSLERLIAHIVRDTVVNFLGIPRGILGLFSAKYRQAREDSRCFDELTDRVLASRSTGEGLWGKLKSDAPDDSLRSNIKVFLAGALEATTSYATWAISHLARNQHWQKKVYEDVRDLADYSPENLESTKSLFKVLDETLRLTPSLYFLPRKATIKTHVSLPHGPTMVIPKHTHILLDVWHANRHEDHWGTEQSGFPADQFAPDRWESLGDASKSKEFLHFGFGHGARVCPGKHLGQLEVALVVGVFVKLFEFSAPSPENATSAGVSTKPADGTRVTLKLRKPSAGMTSEEEWAQRIDLQ